MGCDIGIIGIGVMGRNLALNMSEKGYTVSVYDSSPDSLKLFSSMVSGSNKFTICSSIGELVFSLDVPRKILLMVPAGKTVDVIIQKLLPYLDNEDIIIDSGNSYFKDTIKRYKFLKSKGIGFLGLGISGGEKGARFGPSLMIGGSKEVFEQVKDIFTDIAAKVDQIPCCAYIADDGAGHFVKMVHNGIEYTYMQIISEAYFLLENLLKMIPSQISDLFSKWNEGFLSSYLFEITSDILKKVDDKTNLPLVDVILDSAEQKGTGKWAAQEALEIGVFAPSLAEAVFVRFISSKKDTRVMASEIFNATNISARFEKRLVDDIKKALIASTILIFAQGFDLIRSASSEYKWNIDLATIATIWRGGCIIRAKILEYIRSAFIANPNLENLLFDSFFKDTIISSINSLRNVVKTSIEFGLPIPGFASCLQYYDLLRTKRLPTNLIQAQRDYFGAHKYRRIDEEGFFHTDWL